MKLNHKLKYAIAISVSTLSLLLGFQNCAKTLNTEQSSSLAAQTPAAGDISLNATVSAFGNPVKLLAKSNGSSSVKPLSLCFVADLNGNVKTCSIKFSSLGVGTGKALLIKSKAVKANSKCIIDLPDVHKEYSIGFQLNYDINTLSDQFEFVVVQESSVRIGPNTTRVCTDTDIVPGQSIFKADIPLQMFPYVEVKQQSIKFQLSKLEYKFNIDIPDSYNSKSQKIELIYGCRDAIGVYREAILKQVSAPYPKSIVHEGSADIDSNCNYVQVYYVSSWEGFQYTGTHNSGNLPSLQSIGSKVISLTSGQCNDGIKTFVCTTGTQPPVTPVTPVKCTYYSQRVHAEEAYKTSHCTNPGSSQLWEKASCEYNSRGCGKGTCQCSTTGEVQNGVCVLTNKQKDIVRGFGLTWASLLTDASAPEIKAPSTNSCQPPPPPNNPVCTNPAPEVQVVSCQDVGYAANYVGSSTRTRQFDCKTQKYSDWARKDSCTVSTAPPSTPACTNPAPEVITNTCQQVGYPAGYTGSYVSTRQYDCKTNTYTDWSRNDTCKAPPPAATEACSVYEFSDVVEVSSDWAHTHCDGWNGTGLSGAQSTGKVFCEYNSQSCGVGKCQCYNTLQGVKLPNGTCSVQGKGSRATKSTINRCLRPEQDLR